MPSRKRPEVGSLFPGLERRAEEARRLTTEAAADKTQASGRGRRSVLRTQDEIEHDLRELPEAEREAVLSSSHLAAEAEGLREQIRHVDITLVAPNPAQPRKHFGRQKMDELTESIREIGVLNPIHVQALADGSYRIIAGERRWRAARRAGRTNIPVIVKEVDDRQALELALMENLQRDDLTPIDEAAIYRAMMTEFDLTQAEIGKRIGKQQAHISKMLALLELPAAVQALMSPEPENIPHGITAQPLSAGAAYVLGRISDPAEQEELARRTVAEGLSVRELEALVRDSAGSAGVSQQPDAPNPQHGQEVYASPPEPRRRTVYPTSFSRPAPGGPPIRFSDLSVFQLHREMGRVTLTQQAT